jgi:hypothetical protein
VVSAARLVPVALPLLGRASNTYLFNIARSHRSTDLPSPRRAPSRPPRDVDACNGNWDGNDFGYVSTRWHPYVSGCQGPTNLPHEVGVFPNCSDNGIDRFYCLEEDDACDEDGDCCSEACNSGGRCAADREVTEEPSDGPSNAPSNAPTEGQGHCMEDKGTCAESEE